MVSFSRRNLIRSTAALAVAKFREVLDSAEVLDPGAAFQAGSLIDYPTTGHGRSAIGLRGESSS